MAPKNAKVVDNPPMGSSSEEEESGSTGEGSESSAEDSKKDESKLESFSEGESDSVSDSDSNPAKKNKQTVVTSGSVVALPERSAAKSKLESDSEGESDSDSDSEPAKKKNKPSVVASGSAATLPESSTAKRPLEQAEPEANKKLKTSATEHVKSPKKDAEVKKISGDEAKKMFQRLFSETDEIALLQSVLDFTSTKRDPYEESDAFCAHVKKLIDFDATKVQIVTKLTRLRKKYNNTVRKALKKGKSQEEIVFAKDLDQKAFELSRKIWGDNGVLFCKTRKKVGETLKRIKEIKLKAHSSPKKQQEETEKPTAKVVNTSLSIGREIASFFNAENSNVSALDETTIAMVWEKVADGAEKREAVEKWKKLKAKQVELCLQRAELVKETAKMIFKAYES